MKGFARGSFLLLHTVDTLLTRTYRYHELTLSEDTSCTLSLAVEQRHAMTVLTVQLKSASTSLLA